VFTDSYTLDQAEQAFAATEARTTGKGVFVLSN
jgi:hypothetical protein